MHAWINESEEGTKSTSFNFFGSLNSSWMVPVLSILKSSRAQSLNIPIANDILKFCGRKGHLDEMSGVQVPGNNNNEKERELTLSLFTVGAFPGSRAPGIKKAISDSIIPRRYAIVQPDSNGQQRTLSGDKYNGYLRYLVTISPISNSSTPNPCDSQVVSNLNWVSTSPTLQIILSKGLRNMTNF